MEEKNNRQSGKLTLPLIAGGILLLAIVGFFTLSQSKTDPTNSLDASTSQNESAQVQTETNNATSAFNNRFLAYSQDNLKKATENGKAVIFFHAGWCPTCQAAEADFQSNFEQIPENVTILKADYDTEAELKSKYGIIMQDTFVEVDAQGNEIAKWNSGGEGVKMLLANLK